MQRAFRLLFAASIVVAPSLAIGQTAPGQGQNHGQGYNHQNGPASTGQPDQDCAQLIADGLGATPGNSANSPGSAFNPNGNAGTHYAGEQLQNSRNSASVSQYDSACQNQPL